MTEKIHCLSEKEMKERIEIMDNLIDEAKGILKYGVGSGTGIYYFIRKISNMKRSGEI